MNLVIQKVKDKQYVSFRESYWDPVKKRYSSRTIKNLGRLDLLQKDNPNILEELRAQAKQAKILSDERKELIVKQRVDELSTAKKNTSYADNLSTCLGLSVYWQIWEKLGLQKQFQLFWKRNGIRFDLPKSVFFLLTARVLFPDSKLSSWLSKNQFLYGAQDLSLKNLYRAIYVMHGKVKFVRRHINKQIAHTPDSKVTLVIYDLTDYYVGDQPGKTVESGGLSNNKDYALNKLILTLLIDERGVPIDYGLRLCEPSGIWSILPLMMKIRDQYKVERVVVTADLGFNNENILSVFRDQDASYVSFYDVRESPSSVRRLIRDEKGWSHEKIDVQPDCYTVNKYRITRGNFWSGSEEQSNNQEELANLLINYSAKRERKDREDRLRLKLSAENFLDSPREERIGWKSRRRTVRTPVSNRAKRGEEVYDGYRGIAFSDPELSAQQVMEIYNSVRELKKFFRASASLQGSHWKEKRVKAHIFISFLALMMQRYLEWELKQKGLNLSSESIVEALQKAVLQKIEVNPVESIYCKSFTEGAFDQICAAIGIEKLPTVASEQQVKKALHIRSLD